MGALGPLRGEEYRDDAPLDPRDSHPRRRQERATLASWPRRRDPPLLAPKTPPQDPLPTALIAPIEDYLDAGRAEVGLARATLRAYRSDLTRLAHWLARRGVADWADLQTADVVDYLGDLRRGGAAEATVARALVAARMLVRYLLGEGVIRRDPTAHVPAPVLRRLLPSSLNPSEVERLLEAASGSSWLALRDRALLETLYACGARVSEAIGLRTDGLEPQLRVLRLHGKGDKMRVVPLGARAKEAIERWLADGRPQVCRTDRTPALFLSRSGRPLTRTDAWRRVQLAAAQAGLPRVTPHTLRHSFASHLLAGGADLRAVQEMLGHASIRTTEVYTHLDPEHIRGLHRLYHPRG